MKAKTLKAVSLVLCVSFLLCLLGCGNQNATSDLSGNLNSENPISSNSQNTSHSSNAYSVPVFSSPYTPETSSKVSSNGGNSSTVSGTSSVVSQAKPLYTPSNPDPKYAFDGAMSFDVLNRYLDHAMTFSALYWQGDLEEHIRMFKNLGIKYVPRVVAEWDPGSFEQERGDEYVKMLETLHHADPDIIAEACIFECVSMKVGMITIPQHVQEAFGQTYKKNRKFDIKKMMFEDGFGEDKWGYGMHVPDITRIETQMFFYTRACEYIDMGFESLHLGQADLIGHNDENNAAWTKVIRMIKDYAKKNARRHYVMINAHTNPTKAFVGTDGIMLVDFNAYPVRMHAAEGETDHEVSEDNPQKCTILNHTWASVYKQGISGKHPSGWFSDKYPYLVEFDNGSIDTAYFNKAERTWGYDEISWYAYQPYEYRKEFMTYLYEQIESFNENGHIALPGSRGLAKSSVTVGGIYFANSKSNLQKGWGDEGFYKELLEKYCK